MYANIVISVFGQVPRNKLSNTLANGHQNSPNTYPLYQIADGLHCFNEAIIEDAPTSYKQLYATLGRTIIAFNRTKS